MVKPTKSENFAVVSCQTVTSIVNTRKYLRQKASIVYEHILTDSSQLN